MHILTARNMRTHDNNLEAIHKHTKPVAEKWLKDNGISYDEITFGKPWCGDEGFYVDDKMISIEEFVFKFQGPFFNKTFDVIVPFYNEQENIQYAHSQFKKLERLLNINKYIYIQNGSEDDTKSNLIALAENDSKVHIVDIKENKGYGYGFQQGFKESNSDYILTNHSDCQFDAYTFLITHMDALLKCKSLDAIFPKRLNRPLFSVLRTFILQKIIGYIIGNKEIADFNGQPKLMRRKYLPHYPPNDFCLDLSVYLAFQKPNLQTLMLPIIEKQRHAGTSSWAKNKKKQFLITFRYISYAFKRENK